jgi:hypothetical protein
MRIE